MNVAIFASAFHPSLGGVEELVRQLAHEYRRQGISAIVLTNRWPRKLRAEERFEGIPVYRLAMRLPEYNFRVRSIYWLTYPWTRAKMLRILRRHHIDLLHVQCVGSNGHYASVAQNSLGLPLVLTAQGERTIDAGRVYENSPFQNRVLRRLLEEASHVTACSRNTLADLEEYRGHPFGDRGSVVYNGISVDEFRDQTAFAHPRPYILAIGRMVPQKGFDLLIEAFAMCEARHLDLVIAGEGPDHESLQRLVQERSLQSRVHFPGRADRPTAAALFNGCEFFVLPSRQEPLGIVNLEAMAAGKAVIASNVGGVPEIVTDGQTGLLVPPQDVAALASAMTRVGSDDSLRTRLGRMGRERVQAFGWSEIAQQYTAIYSKALARKESHQVCSNASALSVRET